MLSAQKHGFSCAKTWQTVLQIQKAGGCGDLEGRGLLQEGHEAMPDVQNRPLASSESSKAGQEEGTDRKATILPNTLN
jgi:hypothetical protein